LSYKTSVTLNHFLNRFSYKQRISWTKTLSHNQAQIDISLTAGPLLYFGQQTYGFDMIAM